MREYLYYLFDFDLTLADSSKGIVMCFTNVLHRHGYMDVTEMEIKRTIGKTLEESFSILTGVTDAEQLAAWKKEYTKEADIYMNDNTVLFPETVEVLTRLKAEGAKLAIISTKYRYRIQAVIDKYFPSHFIDVIIGGEDVKVAKPNPQGVKTALRKLKAKKKYALYIGDSTVDAETAQNAGIDFCGVLNGLTTREELSTYPHRQILSNLTLLPLLLKKEEKEKEKRFDEARGTHNNFQFKKKQRAAIIHQIRGNQDKPLEKLEQHVCKNCGDTFEGDFCRSCGQPAKTKRITVKGAFTNFFSSFFSIESGFLRTCYELFWRPGYMVKDFVKGKRIGYYKPFSMMIVLAALYLIAGQLINPNTSTTFNSDKKLITSRVDSLKVKFERPSNDTIAIAPDTPLEADEDEVEQDEEKNGIDVSLGEWIDKHAGPGTFIRSLYDLLSDWLRDNQAFLFIITIPFYLFGVRRGFRYTRMNQLLNTGEYVFIFGYFGSQIIMKDMFLIPFTGVNPISGETTGVFFLTGFGLEVLLMLRNFKQLFCVSWKEAIKCTLKSYGYIAVCLLLYIAAMVVLFSAFFYAGIAIVNMIN